MTKTLYVVKYNDTYGNGDKQKLEVIVENRNHFLEWLDEHNESRGGSEPETEEEFNLIPLNVYVSESIEGNSINVPICYYEDDNNKKVYDFEEMAEEFEMELSKLDDSVVVMVSVDSK